MNDEAPALGISVAEKINTNEQYGPGPTPAPAPEFVEANAFGLLNLREDGSVVPIAVAFLAQDKSPKKYMKGLRYNFRFNLEVK